MGKRSAGGKFCHRRLFTLVRLAVQVEGEIT
jgi:hypothetical protein